MSITIYEPPIPERSAEWFKPGIDMRLGDCMDLMDETPDGFYDLAIVDPPYGISAPKMGMGSGFSDGKYTSENRKGRLSAGAGKLKDLKLQTMSSAWDATPPGPEYFAELRRVSAHQIIWGGELFSFASDSVCHSVGQGTAMGELFTMGNGVDLV